MRTTDRPAAPVLAATLDAETVRAAARRNAGAIRPVSVVSAGDGLWYALELHQHTGSFKAQGLRNFLRAHHEAGLVPEAGVTIASGGNAGTACAWAARDLGVRATVFVPESSPEVKRERLRSYGAEVRVVGAQYPEALAACQAFAAESGALAAHAYDHPLVAAGAGTLVDEIRAALPEVDALVVAVGGGGLFAGVATAAREHGIRVIAVEPENCPSLGTSLAAGVPTPTAVSGVAADSLGAFKVSQDALDAARHPDVTALLVTDEAIVAARRDLWDEHRIVVENGAAAALAGLRALPRAPGENVVVVLCGANTDPSDLA
ncbi:serine/threonine dehydratase [Streptomyces sp. BI20]|uniref:serine/threonine dehydratase n=1 Tax=Streptomyces sp. BI20 TaxID=3403460 RepID=UPI003C7905CF